jgi:hypothetical protein
MDLIKKNALSKLFQGKKEHDHCPNVDSAHGCTAHFVRNFSKFCSTP